MLKRIIKIQQFGCFNNYTNMTELHKTNVIFGDNTSGKSTLSRLFYSLAKNDNINNHKSIPNDETKQLQVNFVCIDSLGNAKEIKYSDNTWNTEILTNKIWVYNEDFVLNNIINGNVITRENKKSFSDFILGEEGVNLANEIAEKKQLLQTTQTNLKGLLPIELKNQGKDLINNFVKLNIEEPLTELNEEELRLKTKLENLNRVDELRLNKKIDINENHYLNTFEPLISKYNLIISKQFEIENVDSSDKVKTHLITSTKNHQQCETWLRFGYTQHSNSQDCPFCGQDLQKSEIYKSYKDYFNLELNDYTEKLVEEINLIKKEIEQCSFNISGTLVGLQKQINKQSNLFGNKVVKYEYLELINLEKELSDLFNTVRVTLLETLDKKQNKPFLTIDSLPLDSDFGDKITEYKVKIEVEIEALLNLNSINSMQIDGYSNLNFDNETIERNKLTTEIKNIKKKILRVSSNSNIVKYINEENIAEELEKKLLLLNSQLDNDQAEFIEKYLTSINQYLPQLGSRNFYLKKTQIERGYRPVIELKVIFKDREFPSSDIYKLISESDRRTLALSIFLTKLDNLPNPEECIIVLDDPVVSFDDNRITSSTEIIRNLDDKFKQLIVLTHYKNFAIKLINKIKQIKLFEIRKTNNGSVIIETENSIFLDREYTKNLKRLHKFINREIHEIESSTIRIIIEEFVRNKFEYQIIKDEIKEHTLGKLLDKLKVHTTSDKIMKLEYFNNETSPNNHTFIQSPKEDKISLCKDILVFLYETL